MLSKPACEGHDTATLRRPESFPGQRSVQFLAASRTPQDYGLIIILAELGAPTAYAKPGSKVTTMLYA